MRPSFVRQFDLVSSVLLLTIISSAGSMNSVIARENLAICESPRAGEYLLLVVTPTTNSRNQLRRVLPNEIETVTCTYLHDTVTRISGFNDIDDANRWAKYIDNIVGLSSIITTKPEPTPTKVTSVPAPNISFNPQILGQGYAVLVDYFNRPELANRLQQVLGDGTIIGFVSYGQRPYLLAVYTATEQLASSTMRKLNQGGFFPIIVDSSRVVLLRASVVLHQSGEGRCREPRERVQGGCKSVSN